MQKSSAITVSVPDSLTVTVRRLPLFSSAPPLVLPFVKPSYVSASVGRALSPSLEEHAQRFISINAASIMHVICFCIHRSPSYSAFIIPQSNIN